MSETQIDELQIKINVVDGDSVKTIENITSAINDLNESIKGGSAKDLKEFASALSAFSDSFKNIGNAKSLFTDMGTGLKSLFDTLSKIDPNKSARRLDALSRQLDKLARSTATLGSMGNGFSKFSDGLKGISGASGNLSKIGTISQATKDNAKALGEAAESASKSGTKFHDLVSGLSKLPEALKGIQNFKVDPKTFDTLANVVQRLNTAISGINTEDAGGFEKIVRAFNRLGSMGANVKDLSRNLTEAGKAMSDFIKQINSSTTDEEAVKFEGLAQALNQVTEAYRHLSAAQKAVSKGADVKAPRGGGYSSLNSGVKDLRASFSGKMPSIDFGKMAESMGMTSETAASLASTLSEVAAAIGLVVIAIQTFIKYVKWSSTEFEKIKNTAIEVATKVRNVFVEMGATAQKVLNNIFSAIKNVQRIANTVSKQFGKFKDRFREGMQSAFGGSGNLFKDFAKNLARLGRMLSSMVLFTVFYKAFGALKDSLDNLVEYARAKGNEFAGVMDSFTTNMTYLGNSLIATVAPAIEALMPLLETAVDTIVKLLNFINMVVSFFTGKNSWTSAVKTQQAYKTSLDSSAKSAKSAADAQKELNRQLMGFDEINKLNDNSKKSSSGGGAAGADPLTMFKENEFPDWLKDVDSVFEHLNNKIIEIKKKIRIRLEKIDWDKTKADAERLGQDVMSLLNNIFGDAGFWGDLGKALAEAINSIVRFAKGMLDEWKPEEWAKAFLAFWKNVMENIEWDTIDALCKEAGEKLGRYLNTIFKDLQFWKDLGNTAGEAFNAFNIFANELLKTVNWLQAGVAFGTAIQAFFDKADIDLAFENVALTINAGFKAIRGIFETVNFEKDTKKIADGITHGLKKIDWDDIQATLGLMGTKISEVINALAADKKFWEALGDTLANAVNGLANLIGPIIEKTDWGTVGTAVGTAVDKALSGIEWDKVLTLAIEVPQKILDALAGFFGKMKDSDFPDKFADAVNTAVGKFDVEKVKDNLVTIADSIGTQLGTIIGKVDYSQLADKIMGFITSAINAVATLFDSFGESAGGFAELGKKVGDGIETAIKDFFTEDNTQNIAGVVSSITEFLKGVFDSIDWLKLRANIHDFIERIPLEDMFAVLTEFVIQFWQVKNQVVVGMVGKAITGAIKGAVEFCESEAQAILTDLGGYIIGGFFEGITLGLVNLATFVQANLVDPFLGHVKDLFGIHSPSTVMKEIGGYVVEGFLNGLSEAWTTIITWWTKTGEAFITTIETAWNGLKIKTDKIWSAIATAVTKPFGELKKDVEDKLSEFAKNIKGGWDDIKDKAEDAWNDVKGSIEKPVKAAKKYVEKRIKELGDWLEEPGKGFAKILKTAQDIWNDIGDAISKPVKDAKKAVETAVGEIKDFFEKTKLKLKIKVPHIELDGGEAPWGIAGKGRLPSFDVKWNAKGGILNDATIFGMAGNTLLGGGEAGKEAVLPLERNTEWMDSLAVRLANQLAQNGPNNVSVPVEVTIKTDNETLYKAVRQGERDYNGRYHVSMG